MPPKWHVAKQKLNLIQYCTDLQITIIPKHTVTYGRVLQNGVNLNRFYYTHSDR